MLENQRVLISFKMSKLWITKKSAPEMILLDFKIVLKDSDIPSSNKMLAMTVKAVSTIQHKIIQNR